MSADVDETKLEVQNDMRVGAIGRTRTGKTKLMQHLLKSQKRVIVVDTKHGDEWPGFFLTEDGFAALNPDAKRVVYRVPEATKVPDEWWLRAMRYLHAQGGGIIYIDEMPMITKPNFAPPGLLDVFRIGGGLGVGVWWSAQEATGVANTVIRQSEVLCLFNNHGASDRDKLIATCGDMGEVTKDLGLYEFVVYRSSGVYNADEIPVLKAEIE